MKSFGLTKTKLFHFHRIFKNGGWGGGLCEPPEPLWICQCVVILKEVARGPLPNP